MKLVVKYIKRKSADGTTSIVAFGILIILNALYLGFILGQDSLEEISDFCDVANPRTYLHIIISSIIAVILIFSLIFHKIKTKSVNCSDQESFDEKVKALLDNEDKEPHIEKIILRLIHPQIEKVFAKIGRESVIEIPVSYDTTIAYKTDNELFKEIECTLHVHNNTPSDANISRIESKYPKIPYNKVSNVIEQILLSKMYILNGDHYSWKIKYNDSVLQFCNKELKEGSPISLEFSKIFSINSVKICYDDGASKELKLEEKPRTIKLPDHTLSPLISISVPTILGEKLQLGKLL